MVPQSLLCLLSLPLLASAHFHMLYPTPRSDEDDSQTTFPCGGFQVSENRTVVSSSAFPLALELGHDRSVVQVLLGLGNDVGDGFSITLEQTFQQQGEGSFCLPAVQIPTDLNITEGTNATLQVVTDAEGGGGLYICADLTFSSAPTIQALPSACTNGTGVTAFPLSSNVNANQTNGDGTPQSGSSDSGSTTSSATASTSATGTATGATSSSSNTAAILTAEWGMLGALLLGAAAML